MDRDPERTKSRRIQTTIALAFAALVVATALVMALLSYSFTQDAVRRTSREYTRQLIAQVQANIDSYITHMENIAEVVQLNEQVQSLLDGAATMPAQEKASARGRITTFLNSILRTRNDISLILIAGLNGETLTHDEGIRINETVDIPEQEWYRRAMASTGEAVVSSSHVQNIVAGEYRWVITLSRTINDPATGEVYGVMLVDLNFSVINDLLSRISLGRKGYMYIVDGSGSIVYHPRQELIYSDIEEEQIERVLTIPEDSFSVSTDRGERIYTVGTSRATGWRTVGVNVASDMVRNRRVIQRYYVYWSLVCLIGALIVAVLISHRLSRPITRLRASMQSVERGNFDIPADVTSNDEIGHLAKDFNIMIAQIKELMRRNAEEQEEKRKSELLALQNQITPHFLYNTLDSVIWMAEGKQYENVITTVSSLARLLRLSVSRGDELITIRDEIEHIKSYLTIQKLRYRDKLDFFINVDGDILALRTPKVILQPLVENAIYHGIKNKEGAGRVTVSGRRSGDAVVLEVHDDGVGMSEERIQTVLHESGDGGTDASRATAVLTYARAARLPRRRNRVGVRNVHERIQLYFGEEFGLSFHRNNSGGTTVEVGLPVISSEEMDHA